VEVSDTGIAPRTAQAYRETHYRTEGDEPVTLRVEIRPPTLARIHKEHDVTCSAFITPCNRFSQLLSNDENHARCLALTHELDKGRYSYLDGVGQHATVRLASVS